MFGPQSKARDAEYVHQPPSPWMRRITRQMVTGKPVIYFEDGRWRCTWRSNPFKVCDDDDGEDLTDWMLAANWCSWANGQPFAQNLAYDFRIRHKNAVTALRVAGL